MKYLFQFICLIWWVAGLVVAKGFWSTFFAVICPLWSFYLFAEAVILKYLV